MPDRKIQRGIFLAVCSVLCIACMQAASVEGAIYSIAADVNQQSGPWNRFYEQVISTDHMHDMLSSFYGRNMQNALRRGAIECGFKYFRGHGILNSDIALYSEPGGVPTYDWSKFDSVYNAAKAIGIRPIVEFSFTPLAMASGTSTCLWYNGAAGNTTLPKDFNKWRDLCDSIVRHCESLYGKEEVEKWFFEVYNEPNLGNFFSGSEQDYFKLYDYASDGVRRADSLCKVGGPASAGLDTIFISGFLKHVTSGSNLATGATGSKCDFLTYHRYATDPAAELGDASGSSNPQSESDYHKAIIRTCKNNNFTGLVFNDEWGLSAYPIADRENERNASYVVKTIHMLLNNGADYPPPYMYGYWCMSDIYEEYNAWQTAGRVTAFDNPGNYGICLRGDPNITDSYDVGKPVFNAFKLLHQMGDIQISCTGGIFGNGPNAFSTISKDTSAVQVLVYSHTSVFNSDSIILTVSNIPFANARIEHFIIDSARSNSYRAWQALSSPPAPTSEQWAKIKAAADLKYYDSVQTVALTGNTYTGGFSHHPYSVSLILIRDPSKIAVLEPNIPPKRIAQRLRAEFKNNDLLVSVPLAGQHELALFNVKGAMVFKTNTIGRKTTAVLMPNLQTGAYVLRCGSGASSLTTRVVLCR